MKVYKRFVDFNGAYITTEKTNDTIYVLYDFIDTSDIQVKQWIYVDLAMDSDRHTYIKARVKKVFVHTIKLDYSTLDYLDDDYDFNSISNK